ncbi:MAG: bis(5'-nucleosyl)-tetraphosphatase (symmetrical) YqeK [Spirochaetaceae bacterium]|jgi:nicotinate-nucleotide adenylyltransferase|nr:bis(5'-nucleosyl)-tetraphosphatase (symmetrical) YqeK [Spirochaetaceae bacterium]
MNIDPLAEKITVYAGGVLPPSRYEHSLRTAETAAQLCRRFGIDPAKGRLAGIGHDICKTASTRMLFTLSEQDGVPITLLEKEKPSLLHGRAAAVMLRTDFGVDDEELLDAIRNHTFGRPGMGLLAKILYVADKIEPGRDHISKKQREEMFLMDIDDMVRTVITENIEYLKKKSREISPLTQDLLRSLAVTDNTGTLSPVN